MRARPLALLFALVSVLSAACVDITPLALTPRDAAPARSDAAAESSACLLCFQAPAMPGPGCAEQWNACNGDDKCMKTVACAAASGCFAKSSQPDVISCGLECAKNAGILAASDPSVSFVLPVIGCSLGACATACKEGNAP